MSRFTSPATLPSDECSKTPLRECSLRLSLRRGKILTNSDTWEMATFARDYAASNGPNDPIFTKYFGTDPKAFSAVIGIWEALLTSNKEGVLFRCDNPDGVSRIPGPGAVPQLLTQSELRSARMARSLAR